MTMFIDQLGVLVRSRGPNATTPTAPVVANNNNSSTTADGGNSQPNKSASDSALDPFSLCAAIGLVILFLICAKPKICFPAEHRRREEFIRRRAQQLEQRRQRQAKLADPKARQKAIANGLIVQQIVGVEDDEKTNRRILTLGDPVASILENEDRLADYEDFDDDDDDFQDEDNACVICLEPFRINDVVAWSRQVTGGGVSTGGDVEDETINFCQHVFHRECIEFWLMNTQHDDCPSCRTKLVHPTTIDEDGDEETGDNPSAAATANDDDDDDVTDDDLEQLEAAAAGPGIAFVIINGLVSRARRASFSLVNLARVASFGNIKNRSEEEINDKIAKMNCVPTSSPYKFRRVLSLGAAADHQQNTRRRSFGWRPQVAAADPQTPSRRQTVHDISTKDYPMRRVISSSTMKRLEQEDDCSLSPAVAFRRVSSSSSSTTVSRRRSSWVNNNNNSNNSIAREYRRENSEPIESSLSPSWKTRQQGYLSPPALKRTVSWSHQAGNNYKLVPPPFTNDHDDDDDDKNETVTSLDEESQFQGTTGFGLKPQPKLPWNFRPSRYTLTSGIDDDDDDENADIDYDEDDEDDILGERDAV